MSKQLTGTPTPKSRARHYEIEIRGDRLIANLARLIRENAVKNDRGVTAEVIETFRRHLGNQVDEDEALAITVEAAALAIHDDALARIEPKLIERIERHLESRGVVAAGGAR